MDDYINQRNELLGKMGFFLNSEIPGDAQRKRTIKDIICGEDETILDDSSQGRLNPFKDIVEFARGELGVGDTAEVGGEQLEQQQMQQQPQQSQQPKQLTAASQPIAYGAPSDTPGALFGYYHDTAPSDLRPNTPPHTRKETHSNPDLDNIIDKLNKKKKIQFQIDNNRLINYLNKVNPT